MFSWFSGKSNFRTVYFESYSAPEQMKFLSLLNCRDQLYLLRIKLDAAVADLFVYT